MDTKPKFLAILSSGWNGSSPFAYTLQRNAKYAHFGYTKTFGYTKLIHSDNQDQNERYKNDMFTLCQHILEDKWENIDYNTGHKMNTSEDLEPLRDFPTVHIKQLVNSPYNINKYVQFYLNLYNHVKQKGYKSVADFIYLGNNGVLTLLKISEFFDIKCIGLVRDPIRTAISKEAWSYSSERPGTLINNTDSSFASKYIGNYTKDLINIKTLVPDTHLVIMEELWEDNGESKQKLSEFLEHPIDELWPNLYSPDIGHHLKWNLDRYYCPTPCQVVGQSDFIITPELYSELRNKYSHIYDEWIKYLGYLPLRWGEPIDYDKNLEIYPHYSYKQPL